MNEMESKIKILMNVYNPKRVTGCYSGLVFDPNGIAPALNTMEGGGRMPFILLEYDETHQETKQHDS